MCLQNKTSQQEFKNIEKKMIYKYAIFLLKTALSKKCLQNKTIPTEIHVFFKKSYGRFHPLIDSPRCSDWLIYVRHWQLSSIM